MYSGLLIPVATILIFNMFRVWLGIDHDYGADLLIAVFTFDVTVAVGLLPNLGSGLDQPYSGLWRELAIGGAFLSFLSAWLSLYVTSWGRASLLPIDASPIERTNYAFVTFLLYLPAIIITSEHFALLFGVPLFLPYFGFGG